MTFYPDYALILIAALGFIALAGAWAWDWWSKRDTRRIMEDLEMHRKTRERFRRTQGGK